MSIPIGETRSHRAIAVDTDAQEIGSKLRADYQDPDDLFDVYCLILFLRLKEKHGWLLCGLKADHLFKILADEFSDAPAVKTAVDKARATGVSASAFGDLEHGRAMALPEFRVRPWL